MAHISPDWPAVDDENWGTPLLAGLDVVTAKVNAQDDQLQAGVAPADLDSLTSSLVSSSSTATHASLTTLIDSLIPADTGGSGGGHITVDVTVPGLPAGETFLQIEDITSDGVTDIGPKIQAAYDAGQRLIKLGRDVTYIWNTPVFLDDNAAHGGLTIEGNKSYIKLGSGLPTSNWSKDGTTKFAIFPNTNRNALSGGSVSVDDSHRATGSGGALRSLILKDVTIDGQGANRGFCYANRTAVTFENVIVYQARVGSTWFSYTDGNTYINCYSRAGSGVSGQVVFQQVTNGDGVSVIGGKADSSTDFAALKFCHGGTFLDLVTASLTFDNCIAINIIGMHQEGQQSTSTMLNILNSQVTLNGCILYENWSDTVASINIDDSANTGQGSEVALNECVALQINTTALTSGFSPFITINANDETRVSARNLKGMNTSSGTSGSWYDGVQPFINGSASIVSATTSPQGYAAIAGGTWTLHRLGSGSYVMETLWEQAYVSKRHTTPSITQVTTESSFNGGTLTATTYTYSCAFKDALGNWSALSTEFAYSPAASQMARILVTSTSGSGTLYMWRATGGTGTSPNAYVVVPIRGTRAYLYDNGSSLAGRKWSSTGIPTRPSTSTNNTVAKMVINGTPL